MVRVTRKHLDAAIAAGACEVPAINTPLEDLPQSDLLWAQLHLPSVAQSVLAAIGAPARVPLWAIASSGDGYGDGYGGCYGYGDGHGDGYGYGYGDGYGYDYGDSDGDGYGDGYGYGYG